MTEYNLHIALKAQNGVIYEDLGTTTSPTLLPTLYDQLASQLGAQLNQANTESAVEHGVKQEPKVTLVATTLTQFDSVEQFGESLAFIAQEHHDG